MSSVGAGEEGAGRRLIILIIHDLIQIIGDGATGIDHRLIEGSGYGHEHLMAVERFRWMLFVPRFPQVNQEPPRSVHRRDLIDSIGRIRWKDRRLAIAADTAISAICRYPPAAVMRPDFICKPVTHATSLPIDRQHASAGRGSHLTKRTGREKIAGLMLG